MNISDLAEDYLIDPKEGMRKLTAGLLNEVMQVEAENQIQARPYERTGKRKRIAMDQGNDHSRPSTVK